jgi:hypothetical protein
LRDPATVLQLRWFRIKLTRLRWFRIKLTRLRWFRIKLTQLRIELDGAAERQMGERVGPAGARTRDRVDTTTVAEPEIARLRSLIDIWSERLTCLERQPSPDLHCRVEFFRRNCHQNVPLSKL